MNTRQITTSIPYMNGPLHIGHALEFLLTDSLTRYNKMVGYDTYFLTGSDEHGSKIWNTARDAGKDVHTMLDENVAAFQSVLSKLDITHDDFIRTTDQKDHWPVTQAIWKRLESKGDLYKKSYTGHYSERHERFVPEKDLDENKNLLEDGSPTVVIEDENYFFKLSKYSDQIKDLITSDTIKIVPEFRKNEMLAFIDQGLEDVSFSRSVKQMSWGIPVPNDEDQVMYVWCDALTNYFSGLRYDSPEKLFENLFSTYVHVIGKDIARFHCLYWVAMLLSADLPLPQNILVHGFVNDKDGNKMSKSVGNVVDPVQMADYLGSDALRFYMLSEAGVGRDIDFNSTRFHAIYTDDLANNYGNYLNRIITLANKYEIAHTDGQVDINLSDIYNDYQNALEAFDTREAINQAKKLLDIANKYLNEKEPWKDTHESSRAHTLLTAIEYLAHICVLFSPFIPDAAHKSFAALGISNPSFDANFRYTNSPFVLTKPEILFEKKDLLVEKVESKTLASISLESGLEDQIVWTKFSIEKNSRKPGKNLQNFINEALENLDLLHPKRTSIIEAYNTRFSHLGLEGQICASQNLENLYKKNGKLPNISRIVDCYNIFSLRTGVSFGVHDLAQLPESAQICIAQGDEDFNPMMGAKLPGVAKGEIILKGSDGRAYGRDIKQSEESKLTEKSQDILLYIQGNSDTNKEELSHLLEVVKSTLESTIEAKFS